MPILLRLFNLSRQSFNGKLPKITSTAAKLPCARSMSLIPMKRQMNEEKYAEKDKVPDGFRIIYRAPMENYMKMSKIGSGFTAACISGLALFKFATDNKFIELSQELSLAGLVAHDSDIWWFAAGFIGINAAITILISKYPLRIYKKDKKYLAIYEGIWPFGVSRFAFNQGEVKASNYVLNPWSYITYKIRNKSSLLLLDYFKTPSEFHEMCGENKL